MASLRLLGVLGALLGLAIDGPASAQGIAAWEAPIAEASARFGIPVAWIRKVMSAESGGHTTRGGRPIRSRVGAMGLMQLMPGTWRAMRLEHGLGADPDNPRDNILAGTAYLRAMYDRFGYPGLFAAYNAGPARYADHLARGRRLPGETVAYLAKVAGNGRAGAAAPVLGSMPMTPGILVARSGRDTVPVTGTLADHPRPSVFFELSGVPR